MAENGLDPDIRRSGEYTERVSFEGSFQKRLTFTMYAEEHRQHANEEHAMGVQLRVLLTSRWFPTVLAVVQIVRHIGLLGFGYWSAMQYEKRFDAGQFIRRDFARPLFEPYGFCGAWTHYSWWQSADFGLDLPAYLGAMLLHSAVTRQPTCIDSFSTPRGQLIAAAFVGPVWFCFGLGVRRLARRRFRRPAGGRIRRALLFVCVVQGAFAFAVLPLSVAALAFSDASASIHAMGISFWSLSLATWAAERLRVWPFRKTRAALPAV